MNFKQIFIVPVIFISMLGLRPLFQEDSYDQPPVFKGNTKEAFPKYIFSKIDKSKYKVTRTYFFELKADEKGKIVDAGLKNGEDNDLAKEIIIIIKKMPKWSPAQKDSKRVKSTFIVPLSFK